ncbi:hypothetical protein FDZ71_15255, partial [bacterium]
MKRTFPKSKVAFTLCAALFLALFISQSAFSIKPPRELMGIAPDEAASTIVSSIKEEDPAVNKAARELVTLHSRAIGGEDSHLAFLKSLSEKVSALVTDDKITIRNAAEEHLNHIIELMGGYIENDSSIRRERAVMVLRAMRARVESIDDEGAARLTVKRVLAKIDAAAPVKSAEAKPQEPEPVLNEQQKAPESPKPASVAPQEMPKKEAAPAP